MSAQNRRDMASRGEPERNPDAYRKQPSRPSENAPAASAPPPRKIQLNEYWIDGEGINRQVLQMEICKYLGNDATSRPGDYEGRAGYKIRALRPFTDEMIQDLREASRAFTKENNLHQKRYDRDLDYKNSQTYEDSNAQMDYSRGNPYPSGRGGESPNYPSGPSGYAQAPSGFPASSAQYSGASGYSVPTTSGPMSMPIDPRYAPNVYDGYQQPPPPQGRQDNREIRNAPAYGSGGYSNQYQQPAYNEPYGGGGGNAGPDPRGDHRMNQDYYANYPPNGGQYGGNGRDTRMDMGGPYESMQGMSAPGGYPPGPGRGTMPSAYENQGREYRPQVNPQYGGGRR